MKSSFSFFNYIFHSCIPVSSKLTSYSEIDYLSRIFCLCFLTFKTAIVFGNQIPFLSRTRCFRLNKFIHHSRRGISVNPSEIVAQPTCVLSGSVMGKNKKAHSSETSPRKKLKIETTEGNNLVENKRKRPNYFVAVQIANPNIHEAIQRIQDHIVAQNMQFNACMNAIATLHITLMVMSITDTETHERALKALRSLYEECNEEMCKNPLKLEFCGLGHFRNRVLYAKIKENESFERLCILAKCVRKHFADFKIFPTDLREFNPHLTVAKIDFSKKSQRALKKIDPSLYETFVNGYVGCEAVIGIQLLSMTNPKNDAGYYAGDSLIFESNISHTSRKPNMIDVNEKKKDIRDKIANLAKKIFK